jgi:hypothetical protein
VPVQSIESLQGVVRITAGRTLTLQDMTLIRDALSRGHGDAQITVDLRGTQSLQPPVLLALATVVSGQGLRVQVLGLDSSSESLLRRLRIDISGASTSDDAPPGGIP